MPHSLSSPRFGRRHLIRLIGAGAGLGALSKSWREESFRAIAGAQGLGLPRGAIIRTVLADIDPNTIQGATLMHEHVGNGRGRGGGPPQRPSEDADWMVEELTAARKQGLGCIVAANTSMPPADMVAYLTLLSQRAGLHVVPTGAYYNAQSYPPDVKTKSEDELADDIVRRAREGRFGAFGEIGVANNTTDLAPEEKKVFRAFAKAQARTGIPIFTHNNYSTGESVPMDMAVRQLDVLEAAGAKPQSVALGHVCCLHDPKAEIAKQVARRGAFVAFDRVTRQQQWVTDEQRIVMIRSLLDGGHVDKLLLASDYIGGINTAVGEKSFYPGPIHAREGGPGYARPLVLFVPLLRKAGVNEDTLRRITQDNPRRFLAFVPKAA